MGEISKISWTDGTFNGWTGCTKVSPGCANCYAETRDKRWHRGVHWGKGAVRQLAGAATWREPVRWNAKAEKEGVRKKVFSASLSDWLDDEVPIEWLVRLLALVYSTPSLDWLLLTKRPENFFSRLGAAADNQFDHGDRNLCGTIHDWYRHGVAPKNVWIGATAEDQTRLDERLPLLMAIPARVRFLSVEPMLGPVRLPFPLKVDWVICGGESGVNARPFDLGWAEMLRNDTHRGGRAFFMKQMGSNPYKMSKKGDRIPILLSDRKGDNINDFRESLRIQQFPTPQ